MIGNYATLEDLQEVLDLVGVPAKAVEQVIVFHQPPIGTVRWQQNLGRSQAGDRVTDYPQHLHLERAHAHISFLFTLIDYKIIETPAIYSFLSPIWITILK